MKTKLKSYPHPVLGNGDDITTGFFKAELTYELAGENVFLQPVFSLENTAIEKYLADGKILFVMEIECPQTFFRSSYSTQEYRPSFSVPASQLRDTVRADFYICAKQKIDDYLPVNCHPDYGNAVFEVNAGDVLAYGGYATFTAEKDFDPLRPIASSFMLIKQSNKQISPMDVDYDSEKITIFLSKQDWINYCNAKCQKDSVDILHASIVLPVLTEAISKIQNNSENNDDKLWGRRLKSILDSKKLFEKTALEAAQEILDKPLSRSLHGLDNILNSTSDDSDL